MKKHIVKTPLNLFVMRYLITAFIGFCLLSSCSSYAQQGDKDWIVNAIMWSDSNSYVGYPGRDFSFKNDSSFLEYFDGDTSGQGKYHIKANTLYLEYENGDVKTIKIDNSKELLSLEESDGTLYPWQGKWRDQIAKQFVSLIEPTSISESYDYYNSDNGCYIKLLLDEKKNIIGLKISQYPKNDRDYDNDVITSRRPIQSTTLKIKNENLLMDENGNPVGIGKVDFGLPHIMLEGPQYSWYFGEYSCE